MWGVFGGSFEGIAETHFRWNGEMERDGYGNGRSLDFEALMIMRRWESISSFELGFLTVELMCSLYREVALQLTDLGAFSLPSTNCLWLKESGSSVGPTNGKLVTTPFTSALEGGYPA